MTPATDRRDVRSVLEDAVAAVPDLLLRTRVVCDAAPTAIAPATLRELVRALLQLEAGLPTSVAVFVTATSVDGGLLLTVEDDAGSSGAATVPSDHVSDVLLLSRATAIARRLGGALWTEEGFDGGVAFVAELPDPAAAGR